MEQWIRLVQSSGEPECTSVEEGLEWIVTRKKEGMKSRYSICYAMRGAAVCRSALSEEERAYEYHDIRKIMGKMPDQQQLFDRLRPEFRELIREGRRMEEEAEAENIVMPEMEDEQIPF